jgi:uncharacterized protein (DUF486 family)
MFRAPPPRPRRSVAEPTAFRLQPAMSPVLVRVVLLLLAANVFMTFAWYGHLKHLGQRPLLVAILVSWGIALFEYMLQVPANRIGATELSLAQLKVTQEVVTLVVFVPFAVWYMKQPLRLDHLWAALCLVGAVYFVFRK